MTKIETLEPRQLLSAVTMTGVQFLGTPKNINSIVLSFSGALDPITSQEVGSYAFGKPNPSSSSSGFDWTSLLYRRTKHVHPETAKPRAVKNGKIQFSSAIYNATANTVTLTPVKTFSALAFLRVLRIRGTGSSAIKDASGNAVNNAADQLIHWNIHRSKTLRYTDAVGNHVLIKLKGPGKLDSFLQRGGNPDPTIFIDGATSSTVITGSVKQNGLSTGSTPISEVQGGEGSSNGLLNNANFVIQSIVP